MTPITLVPTSYCFPLHYTTITFLLILLPSFNLQLLLNEPSIHPVIVVPSPHTHSSPNPWFYITHYCHPMDTSGWDDTKGFPWTFFSICFLSAGLVSCNVPTLVCVARFLWQFLPQCFSSRLPLIRLFWESFIGLNDACQFLIIKLPLKLYT